MKGRKPKLTLIEGGAAPGRCPGPPAWLCVQAKREWKRVAPALHRAGLLGPDTMATVESYCVAVGLVREYRTILEAEGQIIQTESGPRTHPAFKMLMGAMREARLLAAELGVTPHRRGKLAEEPQADAWEGMLA